jgi:hypothetical protein
VAGVVKLMQKYRSGRVGKMQLKVDLKKLASTGKCGSN